MLVRKISETGQFVWKDRPIFVSRALTFERIGLREVDNDVWDLYWHRPGCCGKLKSVTSG
jgi:hypothetical protein